MFDSKTTLATGDAKTMTSATGNLFMKESLKKSAEILSGNFALKYKTTGNEFVDQFGRLGSMKERRPFSAISTDMSTLWALNIRMTVLFTFFIRMITRVVVLFDGLRTSTVQRGAGLRHEGIMRMMWIQIFYPTYFWKNIKLYISVASWRDIIYMLQYDLVYHGWRGRVLDWENMGKLILAGLENPQSSNLVKKYLPQIRATKACKTIEAAADNMVAKWICSLLYGTKGEDNYHHYKTYRKLKVSGNAHKWQQLISQGKHLEIDFNTVAGRALTTLVSGKYLANHPEVAKKYEAWMESKPIVKFTGYPHELFSKIHSLTMKYQIDTLNKQFLGLVETAQKNAVTSSSMIVVRDTSGSMSSTASGTNMSAGDIAKALALFFSYMLPEGHFANSWIEFNSSAKMYTWKGYTPYEKWCNDHSGYIGSTDFQSVIDLFIRIRKSGVDEKEFPLGIICISDSEFNPTIALSTTNVAEAFAKLRAYFSPEYVENFKIVLWNIPNRYYGSRSGEKFETFGDSKNVFYFSGYDGSIVAFLTGTTCEGKKEPKTALELFEAALDQEILHMIEV